MKQFRVPDDDDVGFQMAPMIDITFLLIIFFMVAARISQAEKVKIAVPFASAATVAKDPSQRLIATVREDGNTYLGSTLIVDMAELETYLAERLKSEPGLKLFLRGDQRAEHRHIKDVMKAAAQAGIADIIFASYESDR